MEGILQRQEIIVDTIQKISVNIKKDSPSRKTIDYMNKRLEALNYLWKEFEENHKTVQQYEDKSHIYFTTSAFEKLKQLYESTCSDLRSIVPGPSKIPEDVDADLTTEKTVEKGTLSRSGELIYQQRTNFRAFMRVVKNISCKDITEKWEIQDKLQMLQQRWKVIDEVHWQIDSLLVGSDLDYEQEFAKHETIFETTKKELNQKLIITSHQYQSVPHLDIPNFTGNYIQWPTFMDLFSEAIHNNPTLTKTQKLQHLKGKLRGEPERLIQHLNISAENYDTCWEILNHRYNNVQLLFTKQIQLFMTQAPIQKRTSSEIKRLHDISLETIHAIHNLGVDTTSWDPILVHILTDKLDPETYSGYMEARKSPRSLPSFEELIGFLEGKFTALEPINKKMASTVKQEQNQRKESSPKSTPNQVTFKRFTPKSFHASSERNCPICKGEHLLIYCKEFQNMGSDVKLKLIAQYDICSNCMYCHNGKQCSSSKRCRVCNNSHHTTLHDIITQRLPTKAMPPNSTPSSSRNTQTMQHKSNHVAGNNEVLLATLEINVKTGNGSYMKMRALLDQGSQINLITESAAQRLGLSRRKHNATVSGIGIIGNQSRGTVSMECESIFGDYTFTMEALIMPKMLNNLPNYTFSKPNWPHLHNINLADADYNISRSVDILLDAGVYAQIVMDGILRGPIQAPLAQQTKLGWVLLGNVQTFNCNAVLNNLDEISKFWEMEEVSNNSIALSPEDEYCETLYQNTTKRNADGRYEVQLPMKLNFENKLGSSKLQAVAQFKQLEKRLTNKKELRENYKKFMHEYQNLQHMKECTTTINPSCYLPHHGVFKLDSSTTKLRVVFNGSSKTSSGASLNDLMERGPNLQQDLQSLIIRWRKFRYVYTADVEKFYRQILIQEKHQHLQKIVWRDNSCDVIKEYQLSTITYGTKAAPFLAMRTIKQLIQDDGGYHPLAVEALSNQLYIDDFLGGSNDLEQAITTRDEVIALLQRGCFNLRKWASNDSRLLQDLPIDLISQNMLDFKHAETNKTLGITWNPRTDQFTFQQTADNIRDNNNIITKRSLLSDLSKMYDPLGWLSPITVKAKIIFQDLWSLSIGWDDPLPYNIQREWKAFKTELAEIKTITISRWMGNIENPFQLHGFCDASEKAYACAIYCKSTDTSGQHIIRLVAAKTKLAPLKKSTTLPKLELCGAHLLSKLMAKVIESINIQTGRFTMYGWTDSMVVLGWLQGDIKRWKPFVANRVTQIVNNMPVQCWQHVNSESNSADCASRGLMPSQLRTYTLWWEGPEWLKEDVYQSQTRMTTYETKEEIKLKQICSIQTTTPSFIETALQNHSSMTRLVRVLGWVSRFINRTRRNSNVSLTNYLTCSELATANNILLKHVQRKHFADEVEQLRRKFKINSKSKILNLYPFLDSDGILRVGGRLQQSDLSDSQKHPIILPHKDKLTELLIDHAHKTTLHGGARLTLTYLRNKYWILRGVRTVKDHILKCVCCHRHKSSTSPQLMAGLPRARVTPSQPFSHTGVDFTGQVEVKANKGRGIKTTKGYIAIFICLTTKAVHLELVSDMTTASFLAALKRLCSRRGVPKHMYSDNGTNFVGAAKVLKQEYKEAIQHYINIDLIDNATSLGIEWHFNAPAWPTAGGLWESAVKSMKHHLRRVLGEQKLTFEEFMTLLTQIEACLNSRPLVALTDDIDDLNCLTPGHFLVGAPVLSTPLSPDIEPKNIRTRWQLIQKMYNDFWKRWSAEYLQTLQSRNKWQHPTRNLEIGDVVLMKEENVPPARWPLARVTDTHPGTDGRVRVVSLKINSGSAKRPVTKLSRLPIDTHQPSNDEEPEDHAELSQSATESHPRHSQRTTPKKGLRSYICTLLCLIVMCITPSMTQTFNITELNTSKLIYLDKVADLQMIQDEWKMIVYYNVSTYWQSFNNIQNYITHLERYCKQESSFLSISAQLQHEMNELQHYNDLLISEHGTRHKRGLINGIGYVANSLFGVLDDRYAEKYDKDIKQLQGNERHLLNLYKNHTSIIEGEYNLLKRNEKIMNTQFQIINKHLNETQERIQLERNNSNYIISTALAANMVISNIRRIQQSLLDLITDVRSGRIDIHLLKPEQLQHQLNIISGQLPSELSLPCGNSHHCVREMYQLTRVHLRLTKDFLIFEVKLPLINNEQYELNKIIPIPHNTSQNKIIRIKTTSTYAAINLKKDLIIPLNYEDISTCRNINEHQLLCYINSPTYDIKASSTICEAQIILNDKKLLSCRSEVSSCTDKWLQMHKRNTWLYHCCKQCLIRIFCSADVSSQTLYGTGLISLAPGCMLKTNNLIIHSRNNFKTEFNVIEESILQFQESKVNQIIIPANRPSFIPEDHEEMFKVLNNQIEDIKHQQTLSITSSTHEQHYYVLYTICGLIVLAGGSFAVARTKRFPTCLKHRTNGQDRNIEVGPVPARAGVDDEPLPKPNVRLAVDKATSPFNIL